MKYRMIRGKLTLDDKKYGVGDIVEMSPEVAERLPSNSVVEVSGGSVEPAPTPVYEPTPAVKPVSTGTTHKPTTKKD